MAKEKDKNIDDVIDDVITDFKNSFFAQFGIYPLVSYNLERVKDKVSLTDLENVVNYCLWAVYKGKFTLGIREKSRKRELMIHRQYFFKLAKILTNNTLAEIGYFLGGFDHSSVTYSISAITTLIETRNDVAVIVSNRIKYELQVRYGKDGIV